MYMYAMSHDVYFQRLVYLMKQVESLEIPKEVIHTEQDAHNPNHNLNHNLNPNPNPNSTEISKIKLWLHDLQSSLQFNHKCLSTTWTKTYQNLHKVLVNKPYNLIQIPFTSGFADRMSAAISIFYFAVLSNRAFQIGERSEVPSFRLAFSAPYIEWHRFPDPRSIIDPLREKLSNPYNDVYQDADPKKRGLMLVGNFLSGFYYDKQNITTLLGERENIFLTSNRGCTVRLFQNSIYHQKLTEDFRLSPDTAFGCATNLLFYPKPSIFLSLMPELHRIHQERKKHSILISIQIRHHDDVFHPTQTEALQKHRFTASLPFFSCAESIERFVLDSNLHGENVSFSW
jgi:hypothetical protein